MLPDTLVTYTCKAVHAQVDANLRSLNRANRMMKSELMGQLATKMRMVSTATIWIVAAKR